MRKEEIKEFIENLEKLWLKYPECRFGQLLFNFTKFGTRTQYLGMVVDPFHFQDEDILKQIKKELK